MIRSHWMVENGLHWVLDMIFRDDECRVRTDNAPFNLRPVDPLAGTRSRLQKRGQAFALFGAPVIGPTLGGWLADNLSWRWCFMINGPVGLVTMALIAVILRESENAIAELARGRRFDLIGFVLVATFLGALEVMLDRGLNDDWFGSSLIVGTAVVSLPCLRHDDPVGGDEAGPDDRRPHGGNAPVRRLLRGDGRDRGHPHNEGGALQNHRRLAVPSELAVQVAPSAEAMEPVAAGPSAPRSGSKLARLIELLQRDHGATIDELIDATDWLAHTTRAALTGLRNRGYAVVIDRSERGSFYRIPLPI